VRPPLPLQDFDYDYPQELVATEPARPRDSSRLMVVRRSRDGLEHARFSELPNYLDEGDCLVLNTSKVLACRLEGRKASGGKAELLLVEEKEPGLWRALACLKTGTRLAFPGGLSARVESSCPEGGLLCRFSSPDARPALQAHGLAPLPPYILKRRRALGAPGDRERDLGSYQTVYAREPGSIAAPTAGLHFTPGLLESLRARGVQVAELTLHVGLGTFRPVQGQDASGHKMLPENYRIEEPEAAKVRRTLEKGGRVAAVGTTATRVLETLAARPEGLGPGEGSTELYIRPGHEFKAVNSLLTNFHLPRSTPLLLAAAFLGRERLLSAYEEAFRRGYRLYSYGDAMLIL